MDKSWEEAKVLLHDFYAQVDESSSVTAFIRWVQAAADCPAFVSKAQVNAYYTDFISRGLPLLDQSQISMSDLCFAFIQGTPSSMKTTLRRYIPKARRNRLTPHTINDTLALLHSLVVQDDATLIHVAAPPPISVHSALSAHPHSLSPSSPALPVAPHVPRIGYALESQAQRTRCHEPLQDRNTQDKTTRLQTSDSTPQQSSAQKSPNRSNLLVTARDYSTCSVPTPSSPNSLSHPTPSSHIPAPSARPLPLCTSSLACSVAPPTSRPEYAVKQQASQEQYARDSRSDVSRHKPVQDRDQNAQHETSQPEAEYMRTFSDVDHTVKLEVQGTDYTFQRSGTRTPPNCSDLSAATHAAHIQPAKVSTTQQLTALQRTLHTPFLYQPDANLHAISPVFGGDVQPGLSHLVYLGRARVGVGGHPPVRNHVSQTQSSAKVRVL